MAILIRLIKSNVIMKGINFNQRPTPVARGSPRATCENSTERMWELVVTAVCTLWFLRLMLLGVCWKSNVPSRAFFLRSPLELIIMPRARMAAPPISVPCRQPDLRVSSTTHDRNDHGRRFTFGGRPHLPHSMGSEQGWGHLRANPGFGVFWFIPPLLSKPIFGQPPL